MKECLKCGENKENIEFKLTNLQPLCSYTNRVLKRDKLDFIFQV
mgnify:CR=1 FL=1